MIQAIVTDIEGTTTSLSFVKDVLFPYAREHMAAFVQANADKPEVSEQLELVRMETGKPLDLDGVIGQLLEWIDQDKKITPLKTLQGILWEAGYREGKYTGHVYEDAVRKLKEWQQAGIRLYVYSSGSVYAQKLLYGYSDAGDMTTLFTDYFDTRIGAKIERGSYTAIAEGIRMSPEHILFLSDIKAELDAAREAGFQTTWLVREGELDANAEHRQVRSFDEIEF